MNLWTKVHGLSETRWHRFPKPVAPVFVGSRGYTRDLPGYSYLFTPFTPIHLPRLRTVKGERERRRFLGDLRIPPRISRLGTRSRFFPPIPRLQQLSHHVRRYPMSWFCPTYFSRDYLLESFGRMTSIWS
jgi:hypothetical protein